MKFDHGRVPHDILIGDEEPDSLHDRQLTAAAERAEKSVAENGPGCKKWLRQTPQELVGRIPSSVFSLGSVSLAPSRATAN